MLELKRDGFVHLSGLLSRREVADLAPVVDVILAKTEQQDGMHREYLGDGRVRQVYELHKRNPEFHRLSRDSRLVAPCMQVLGDAIYVWHSKLNIKWPVGGDPWLWHQDYGYWHRELVEPKLLSIALFLDDNKGADGGMLFSPGASSLGPLPHQVDELATARRQRTVDREVLESTLLKCGIHAVDACRGDAVVFDSLALHASTHNLAPLRRAIFFIAFNRLDNRPQVAGSKREEWVVARDFEPIRSLNRGSEDK